MVFTTCLTLYYKYGVYAVPYLHFFCTGKLFCTPQLKKKNYSFFKIVFVVIILNLSYLFIVYYTQIIILNNNKILYEVRKKII